MHFISGHDLFYLVWRWIDFLDIHLDALQTLEKNTRAIKMCMKTNKNIELTQMKHSIDWSAHKTNFRIKYGNMRYFRWYSNCISFYSFKHYFIYIIVASNGRERIDERTRFEIFARFWIPVYKKNVFINLWLNR